MIFGDLFIAVLNMSWTASFVIVFVLAARLVLKKAPKVFSYMLWLLPLIRLLCPYSLKSVLSLVPVNTAPITEDIFYASKPLVNTGIAAVDGVINPMLPAAVPHNSMNPMQGIFAIAEIIWALGIAVLVLYCLVSYFVLCQRVKDSVKAGENIYVCKRIDTPFVLGFIEPGIYLPQGLEESRVEYILEHERTHIRRKDHIMRLIGFAALLLHWFNPLVWAAYIISARDMESACDEAVIKELGADIKAEYSKTLLMAASGKRKIGLSPVAFGEGSTKTRIKNILSFKKPALWVVIAASLVFILGVLTLLFDPVEGRKADIDDMQSVLNDYVDQISLGTASSVSAFPIDVNGDSVEEIGVMMRETNSDSCSFSFYKYDDGNWIKVSDLNGLFADSPLIVYKYRTKDGLIVLHAKTVDPAQDSVSRLRNIYGKFDTSGNIEVFTPWCYHNVETGEKQYFLEADSKKGVLQNEYDLFINSILDGADQEEIMTFDSEDPSMHSALQLIDIPIEGAENDKLSVMEIRLPKGWSVGSEPLQPEGVLLNSPLGIYDECGHYVGCIAFGSFEANEGDADEDHYYKTVYTDLFSGTDYYWYDYTTISVSETGETALANVHLQNGRTLSGILSYASGRYAAIQFEEDAVTEDERKQIARSIMLLYRQKNPD